jgi:hypothetical protein
MKIETDLPDEVRKDDPLFDLANFASDKAEPLNNAAMDTLIYEN